MGVPVIDPDNHSNFAVENLSLEATVQWVDGGRILVSRFQTSRPETYDVWEAWFRALIADWPMDRPLLLLYDLRSPQFGMTLYIGTKLRALNALYRTLHGPSAIVYGSRSRIPVIVRVLQLMRPAEHRTRDYFHDYDTAIRWLQAHYPPALVEPPALAVTLTHAP